MPVGENVLAAVVPRGEGYDRWGYNAPPNPCRAARCVCGAVSYCAACLATLTLRLVRLLAFACSRAPARARDNSGRTRGHARRRRRVMTPLPHRANFKNWSPAACVRRDVFVPGKIWLDAWWGWREGCPMLPGLGLHAPGASPKICFQPALHVDTRERSVLHNMADRWRALRRRSGSWGDRAHRPASGRSCCRVQAESTFRREYIRGLPAINSGEPGA